MKNLKLKIEENVLPIVDTILLVMVLVVPTKFDCSTFFISNFLVSELDISNWSIYIIILKLGNLGISLILLCLLYKTVINRNSEREFNFTNTYHNYPYFWYWYCSRILRFGKCNLINVPIHMQFRLIINRVFKEFPLDDNNFPEAISDKPNVKVIVEASSCAEVNLILEDTYPIKFEQIPKDKQSIYTIKISRNDGFDFTRHYSKSYVEMIINVVRRFDNETVINVFATTNPKNNLYIAKNVFEMANRGNIKSLIVFQQDNKSVRKFNDKGYVIY